MGKITGTGKYCTLFFVFLLVLGLTLPVTASEVIYKEEVSEPVARGVTYRQTWRFACDGWLRVHVLEVDLTATNVGVGLLYNREDIATPLPLTELASQGGAVAAINGDFFYQQGPYTAPVGPMVQEGRLIASPGTDKGMGVLAIAPDGRIELGPWQGEGYVHNPQGEPFRLAGVNKPGTDYAWPILYTADWGSKTPATPPGVVTLIGIDSMVVRVSEEGEQEIPAGGFALVAGGAAADYFRTLSPTDPIEFSYTTLPPWQEYSTALGGGGIILQDGRVVTEGYQLEGQHPRSAVGVSADGKTLYLVAVDGRQDGSRGLTQGELAQLLLELGAADAINLDGGGSTTLVTRPLGTQGLAVRNELAGAKQRPVPNGLGIFTDQRRGPAAGLVLTVVDENVPLQGTRKLNLRAYDAAYNPVPLPSGEQVWEVIPGDLGRIEGDRFIPQHTGSGQVQVRLGNLEAKVDLRVIGPVVDLEITPERAALEPGSQQEFTVFGVDSQGYRAQMEPEDLVWERKGEIGTLDMGVLQAAESAATGAVIVTLGDIRKGALVTVGREELLLDEFISPGGVSFLCWPQDLSGGISFQEPPEPLPVREGSVLALRYDFTPAGAATRAAYVVLADTGLELPPLAQAVGLWVYGDGSGHWLRGLVEDGEGNQVPLDFARRVDWEGWRYVRANLPANAAKPLTLKRVYLAEPDTSTGGAGIIYLANLQSELPLAWPADLVPDVVRREDPAQLAEGERVPEGMKLLVVGNIDAGVQGEALAAALRKLQEEHGAAYILTTGPLPLTEELALPVLPRGNLPTSFRTDQFYSLFLQATQGGLREGDCCQWEYLQQELALEPAGSPLFVLLDRAPFKGDVPGLAFSNGAEAALLRQYLTRFREERGGEVWVFSGGAPDDGETRWLLEEGVRYLILPDIVSAANFDYLEVILGPEAPLYRWQEFRE